LNAITDALTSITSGMALKAYRLCDTDAIFDENYTFGLNNELQDVLSCNCCVQRKM
jgi:hypothetical protein